MYPNGCGSDDSKDYICENKTMKNFREMEEKLDGREKMRMGNHLFLERLDGGRIAVKYYATYIVVYHIDGRIILNNGNQMTKSTKERINEHSPVTVNSKKGLWFLANGEPFVNGMNVGEEELNLVG